MNPFHFSCWQVLGLYGLLMSSCSINKYLPPDKVLLQRNKVILKKSELTKKQIDRDRIRYVVPNPRYGLLKSYLHNYFRHSAPNDSSGWDRFIMKQLSEKPMWLDSLSVEQTKQDLVKHLNASGYYQGRVDYEIKQKRNRAIVLYTVAPNTPLKIHSIEYTSTDPFVKRLLDSIKPLLNLQAGMPLDEQLLIPDQARIIQSMQDAGYIQINKSNLEYYYEDSTKQQIDLICNVISPEENNLFKPHYISEINVYSSDRLGNKESQPDSLVDGINYKNGLNNQLLKHTILSNYIQFKKGELYNLSAIQRTRNTFQNLGTFRSVSVLPEVMSNDSIRINIYIPPSKKQYIQVDLDGSYVTNRDQLAGNKLFDIRIALQYRHRNLFKGAEQFSASLIPTIGFQIVDGKLLIPWGFNAQTNLTFPRFIEIGLVRLANQIGLFSDKFYGDIKNTARTRVALGNVYELFYTFFNNVTEQSVQRESKISFGYEFTKNSRIFYRFNPVGFDYLNYDLSTGFAKVAPAFLLKSFEDRILSGLLLKELNADINNKYLNQHTSRILLSIESSGLEVAALDVFSKKNILPEFSRFARIEADGRYTLKLSSTTEIGLRLATGIATGFGEGNRTIPFVRQFYVGGPNSIRGWAIREIGPGLVKNNAGKNRFSFFQTGNFKLEFGSEYRFNIFSFLKGAILFDGGNVWLLKKDPLQPGGELSTKFLNQLYLSSGLGLRLDFTYFLIRFDSGIKLRTPYLNEDGSRLYKTNSLNDLQFNLSLGLPF